MPVEDLWETHHDAGQANGQSADTQHHSASTERTPIAARGRHRGQAARIWPGWPRRRRARAVLLGSAAAAVIVLGAGSWIAGADPAGISGLRPVASGVRTLQGTGPAGQIIGVDGLCLADTKGKDTNGTPVTLESCIGTRKQQEWTIKPDKEITANGLCLGTKPGNAADGALVGLYGCEQDAPEQWSVRDGHTIVSASSGLCLVSWKDKATIGNLVSVDACNPASKAQSWTVPSYAVDPSGLAAPSGDIPGWRQAFSDDFTENVAVGQFPAAVSAKWGDYPDGWTDTTGNGTYEPTKVVSIHDGTMNLFLHTADGTHMVAAPYPVIPGAPGPDGGTTYGLYEARFKATPAPGYKTAWLLWPDSNAWSDGEIDFPEGDLNSTISSYLHQLGPDPETEISFPTRASYGAWHTAAVEWTPNSITFLLDGTVIGGTKNRSFIPDTPMHWVLQTETQTTGGPPSNTASSDVQIDWVAAWVPERG